MRNMVSLDAPANFGDSQGTGTMHDVVRRREKDPYDVTGKKPQPLRSSWGMDDVPHARPKKPEILYFVDGADGNTITACGRDKSLAVRTANELRRMGMQVVVRPYLQDEEQLQADISQARAMARWESGFGA